MKTMVERQKNCIGLTATANVAFNRWNEIIKDKVLVAAMVDRLTHKAFLVNMNGQSYRLKETQKIIQKKRG